MQAAPLPPGSDTGPSLPLQLCGPSWAPPRFASFHVPMGPEAQVLPCAELPCSSQRLGLLTVLLGAFTAAFRATFCKPADQQLLGSSYPETRGCPCLCCNPRIILNFQSVTVMSFSICPEVAKKCLSAVNLLCMSS